MSFKKFEIGAKVIFPHDIPEHGINAGAVGVVDSGLNAHVLHSKAYFPKDHNVYVMVYGKVICLPVEFFDESAGNTSGNSEAGIASEQSIAASSGNGQGNEAGIVDASADNGAGAYSVEKAVRELELLSQDVLINGFSGHASNILSVAEKLKTIAA